MNHTLDGGRVVPPAVALGEPRTTDYCRSCGESPQSGIHWIGKDTHDYQDPRLVAPELALALRLVLTDIEYKIAGKDVRGAVVTDVPSGMSRAMLQDICTRCVRVNGREVQYIETKAMAYVKAGDVIGLVLA